MAVSFIPPLTSSPPCESFPSVPIFHPLSSLETLDVVPQKCAGWTARNLLNHFYTHTHTRATTSLPFYSCLSIFLPQAQTIAILRCLTALCATQFFFSFFFLLPISGAFFTELLVAEKNDGGRKCVRECMCGGEHTQMGNKSIVLSWGQCWGSPLRLSWDWVHYSVAVGSSCKRSKMVRGLCLCYGSFSPAVHWGPVKNNAEEKGFTCHIEMERQHLDVFSVKQKEQTYC